MQRYKNHDDSGVTAYQLGPDSITVQFQDGGVYLYTHASTGRKEIAAMKQLARDGKGLATFISQHVRERYADKLR